MDSKTKINMVQETHYISVCIKFEGFILIQDAMNAKMYVRYCIHCNNYIKFEN